MTDETLANGIWYCERAAASNPGVAALLAEYRRLQGETRYLRREINFDALLMPQDAAEIARLRAENERLTTALIDIADGGDFVPLSDIGRRMDIDTARRALGIQP